MTALTLPMRKITCILQTIKSTPPCLSHSVRAPFSRFSSETPLPPTKLPSTSLHHLPRRIAGRKGCFLGNITAGRAANKCVFRQQQRFASWWRGERADYGIKAQSGYKPFSKTGEEKPEEMSSDGLEEKDGRDDYGGFRSDEELSAMDKQYATQTDIPRGIHILGTGSIGKLVAHSLKGIPNPPPVTLLFHRYRLLKAWEEGKKQITVRDDEYDVARSGFTVELIPELRKQHHVELEEGTPDVYDVATDTVRPHAAARVLDQQQQEENTDGYKKVSGGTGGPGDYAISNEPIHNLIVSTKCGLTISALDRVKHRLTRESSICFLQNGMGIIDEVNKHIFPNVEDRPNYVQGVITHGAHMPREKAEEDPFFVVHAGRGTIALAIIPREEKPSDDSSEKEVTKWAPSSRYLVRTLTRSPTLCAVGFTPIELLQQQLEKVAVNSVLNPLTALLDNINGSILHNFALTRTMRLLMAEISHVITSLPELQGVPNIHRRFSTYHLETLVVSIADKTKNNTSSMLVDVRAGERTEIDYMNGYIVRRGEELGVKCVVNYAIMQTVKGKRAMIAREREGEVKLNPD